MRRRLLLLSLPVLLCCGSDSARTVEPDAQVAVDGAIDTDASTSLSVICQGTCRDNTLMANFGGTVRGFDRAFFGLTSPANGDSGGWEVHVESYAGGDADCPTEQSASPERTLIVSGVPVPSSTDSVNQDVAAVSLLDFEGALLPVNPIGRATAFDVSSTAANPCVECASGGSTADERMVALDVNATFAEGTVVGHLFATHCDSLDVL